MTDSYQCDHRKCAAIRLIIMVKAAAEGLSDNEVEAERLLAVGLRALTVIGMTRKELREATLELLMSSSSPLVSDVDHDPTVPPVNSEDAERKTGTDA